jgi:DNA gyrase subunit B
MKELIEEGRIYIAQPPLYKLTVGKDHYYFYSDEELEDFKKTLEDKKYEIQRYKGLGEMNPEQLWETTMDPNTRKLLKVSIEDAETADELFEMLMGSDTESRKEFIFRHALSVKEIDV